jgi:hypothetical protein
MQITSVKIAAVAKMFALRMSFSIQQNEKKNVYLPQTMSSVHVPGSSRLLPCFIYEFPDLFYVYTEICKSMRNFPWEITINNSVIQSIISPIQKVQRNYRAFDSS